MGEVRVHIKLENHVDEVLAAEGHISSDAVRRFETDALVDTGAVRCAIPPFIAQRLGLREIDHISVEYADGRKELLPTTSAFTIEIDGRRERETAVILGDEFLIGQTALEKMDLLVDCRNQRLVGNPAHPDQPVNKIK